MSRKDLNELLLNAAEAEDHVLFHFEHEMQSFDGDSGEIIFRNLRNRKQIIKRACIIVGCDGAYSVVRRELVKTARIDFSQYYIAHGYKEFCIPATAEGKWKLPRDYLHIWPRGDFMLICLPNPDGTFTATLFYPHTMFDAIKSDQDVLELFRKHFPEALEAIGEKQIVSSYWKNPIGSLVTTRCSHYHYKDRVILLGDAAHAMVPFYGQGMNAGFEDLGILYELFQKHPERSRLELFAEYSRVRQPDASAICDLALYNYWEMSTAVSSRLFRLKRSLYGIIHRLLPRTVVPLYSMVSFTTMPYSQVVGRHRRQELIMNSVLGGLGLGAAACLACSAILFYHKLLAGPRN